MDRNVSDSLKAIIASTAWSYDDIGERFADVDVPWYAGYDGSNGLFVYRVGWDHIVEYNLSDYGFDKGSISYVRLVDVGGSSLVLLVGTSYSIGVYLPRVVLLDPGTGRVVKSVVLEVYPLLVRGLVLGVMVVGRLFSLVCRGMFWLFLLVI
ncbi:MAG: hypothetical protein F7B59_02470 [Desulfurococcales archaeon]|nr:hypothetical protein [Desulfurococcales archaeon]